MPKTKPTKLRSPVRAYDNANKRAKRYSRQVICSRCGRFGCLGLICHGGWDA